jgi:beta-glucosidase
MRISQQPPVRGLQNVKDYFFMRTLRHTFFVFLLLTLNVSAQAPAPSQAEIEQRVNSILGKMTVEEKIDMIGGQNSFYIRGYERLGLPPLKMSDGPVGVRNYGPSTAYPVGIALAASWDPELVTRVGSMIGQEARARGVHFMLGPGVNIYRAPMAGRNFEYYGEDPYLASRTAVAYIKGMQSQGVIATVKHFLGNNQEYDRHNVSSDIDERTLREIYLPTFEAAVKEAHVGAIMDSYNLVNGTHMTENNYFNNQIVKKEWGFDGIIMSDWDATYDGVAAATTGLDLEMPSGKFMNRKTLLPAIEAGKFSVATLDDKIRRILRKAIEFGFLDREQTDLTIPRYSQPARELALEAAKDSMVLLKNEGNLLPFDKGKVKSVAVLGPDAYPAVPGGGGSSRVIPFKAVSYLEGLSEYQGAKIKVLYDRGVPKLDGIFDATDFTTSETNGQSGLQAEYFDNLSLQGKATAIRTDRHVNFHGSLDRGNRSASLSVRWTGYYTPHSSGDHEFYVSTRGGCRLYVDGHLALDHWQQQKAETTYTSHQALRAGHAYKITLEYFQKASETNISLGVIGTDALIDPEAKALAAQADVAVVFVGFDASNEKEGSDRTFQLPFGQDELINQVLSANKNTVVVLTAGGNADMTRWIDHTPALVHAWYPGQEGGTALAQLLFGDFSPSGRLPVSFERRWEDSAVFDSYYPEGESKKVTYTEGVFLGYRHFDKVSTKPLFPFGFGLSYTKFQYTNLAISPDVMKGDGTVMVSFDVTNIGQREGSEVAQVYVGQRHASVPRPVKELKGFTKIHLMPNETRRASVPLDRRALSYYDVNSKQWKADAGSFDVYVASSAEQIHLQGKLALQAAETASGNTASGNVLGK